MKIGIFLLSLLLSCNTGTTQNQVKLTPETKLKLVPQKIKIGKSERIINVPEGYKISLFYAGNLSKPRFMSWSPDSVLHVANMNSGEIIALPDKNHDHIADTAILAAKDAYGHDVKFFRNAMYVAMEQKVDKFTDENGDGYYEKRETFIDSILPGLKRPPGGHTTRTIVFDEKNQKVYLSVGSLCNVCREDKRAVIYEYDLEGKNKKFFATGTRNCIGMAIHPKTGDLWATNNGSDHQGNDIPPEWIDVIKENGFYGYPFAYAQNQYFNFKAHEDYKKLLPITSADSARVKTMKKAEALVQAHSALMAIEFSNPSFPKNFSNGAFVDYRGSWDRNPPTGYKVVYLDFDKNNKVKTVSDFITGFLPDPKKEPWARPVGLETDARGCLYLTSDDINQFVLVVYPDSSK